MSETTTEAMKLSPCEKGLVAVTFICLTMWAVDAFLCCGSMAFAISASPPFAVLAALVLVGLIGFARRAVAYWKTKTLACAYETGTRQCALSVLAAVFWTLLGSVLLIGTAENIYYSMQVKSIREFFEVTPINAALVTPAITAVYFILLAILRLKNRRDSKQKGQTHE